MDEMTAFDQQIAREVVREAGPSEPVDGAAILTAITATRSPRWRFQSMFSATKFVVAGAIVALFGGFLLAGVLTTQEDHSVPAVATDAAVSGDGAMAVTGQLLDSGYWQAPTLGPGAEDSGRTEMSDERLSGEVTFIVNGEAFENNEAYGCCQESYLYWGTMVIENASGTWEGTHFAADHHAQPGMHGPLVMGLVGSGDYEGLSAILYRTVVSESPLEESLDGIIFPGELPPDREVASGTG